MNNATQVKRFEGDYVQCNILLIGKTGVGKSTFANYLFDTERFDTGDGNPVTGWGDNFQNYSFLPYEGNSRVRINVYDSVGLEPDNYDKWIDKLRNFLKDKSSKDNPNDQIHIVFYMLNGAGSRIEDTEIEIIRKIHGKFKLPISVVLTQCDKAEGKREALEKVVSQNTGLSPILVCSKCVKMRDGTSSGKTYGKDEAIEEIIDASINKVGLNLRDKLYHQAYALVRSIQDHLIEQFTHEDMTMNFISAYKERPRFFHESFLEKIDIDIPNQVKDFTGPVFEDYCKFLEELAKTSSEKDVKEKRMWLDFHKSFIEIQKIIDLNAIADNTLGDQDLTSRIITGFLGKWRSKIADDLDDIFRNSRGQKNSAKEIIIKRFTDIDEQLKKACRKQ